MPSSPVTKVVEHLRKSVSVRDEDALSDGQLLDRFLEKRDEIAFAALVRRHGPMVWGVCLRIAGRDDAEDAFQATFLILVRKAAGVKPRQAVGNWLYGVASHAALKARTACTKVHAKEKQVTSMPDPAKEQCDDREELQRLLDHELGAMPDKYRLPVVLCDLEGRTRKEVAAQLKIPEGTLSSRLATAHQMLAKRLARHGLAVSGASLAALIAKNAASAHVPGAVVSSTIRTATLAAAGNGAVAGIVSTKVAALTEGVMKAMLLTRLKTMMIALLVLCIVLGGGLLTYRHTATAQQGRVANPAGEKEADGGKDKNSTSGSVLFVLRKLEGNRSISVSIYGTKAEIEDLPLATDVQVLFHGAPGLGKLKGKLTDLGLEGTPLTLDFAPDGRTITRITAYMSISPCFLMEIDAERKTISTAPIWIGIRERLAMVQDVQVVIDGEKKAFGDLRKGMIVDVYPKPISEVDAKHAAVPDRPRTTTPKFDLKRHGPFSKIEAYSPVLDGIVATVDGDKNTLSLTLAGTGLLVKNLSVAADARIVIAGKKRRLSDVKPQTRVSVELLGEDDTPRERRIVSVVARLKSDAPEKDMAKLQGTWAAVSMEREGKALPADEKKLDIQLTFTGGEFMLMPLASKGPEHFPHGTFTIDPAKKPKQMNMTVVLPLSPARKTSTVLAIYDLDGDTLKLLRGRPDQERPSEFKTTPKSGLEIIVFRRVVLGPPKAKDKTEAGEAQKPIDPQILAKLAIQLRSKDWEEKSAAVLALAKLLAATKVVDTDFGPIIEPLFVNAGWGGIAADNARSAEDSLVRIGKQATPYLRQRLKAPDAHDRRVAAELLVRIGPPDAALVTLLRPLLTDPDHYVRKAAIDGLGTVGAPAKETADDLERVATNDANLARRVGARIALIRVAGASEERVRALAAFLEMKDEQNQAGKEAAASAASALGELGPKAKAAEAQLLAALKNPELRSTAAHTLGQIGAHSPEAVTALIDVLKNSPEKEARRSAAGSLGAFGPAAKAAIPALRTALKEDAKGGWWVAADALGKIGGADVVPILTEALVNPDGDIRLTAMRALGNLGVIARPALIALEKARQDDPRESNRAAAAEALRKIDRAIPNMK